MRYRHDILLGYVFGINYALGFLPFTLEISDNM